MVRHVLVGRSVILAASTVSTVVENADNWKSQCNLLREYESMCRHNGVVEEENFYKKKLEIVVIRGGWLNYKKKKNIPLTQAAVTDKAKSILEVLKKQKRMMKRHLDSQHCVFLEINFKKRKIPSSELRHRSTNSFLLHGHKRSKQQPGGALTKTFGLSFEHIEVNVQIF